MFMILCAGISKKSSWSLYASFMKAIREDNIKKHPKNCQTRIINNNATVINKIEVKYL